MDGLHGGAPIMFYNQKLATVIASPLTNFMAASFVQDERSHTFAAGLMGSITYAPAGFTLDTIFVAAQGVNEAMRTWGSAVRQFHGKMAIAPGVDHTIDYLGYYTDNGADHGAGGWGARTWAGNVMGHTHSQTQGASLYAVCVVYVVCIWCRGLLLLQHRAWQELRRHARGRGGRGKATEAAVPVLAT